MNNTKTYTDDGLFGKNSKSAGQKFNKEDVSINIVITAVLTLLALVAMFPFYNVIILSFASVEGMARHPVYLLPYSFDLTTYKNLFAEVNFYRAFGVSVFVTITGVVLNMFLSVLGAYALSKKAMPGRNFILSAILFTMFFSGGLIPYYLVIQSLNLVNNILVMVIPTGITTMYLIIMKNYFNTLPDSIEESAKVDGANDLYILWKIILPISKPFIATFALFYAVDRWNEWYNSLIFISDSAKVPLQIYLRELLINMNVQLSSSAAAVVESKAGVGIQATQMASIVISAIPIMCVYPFLQKHFVRGIMVGSIKE
ncbi:carbohydrate ABC transporter permease [Ruminiclostridium cellobioparum]|uniref:ABC-type sugar transport system, permease component n=1 Tax=Ruminiclostridium cellobioparum subsp. termitidis CT1112 TaxID=1195236 RepID=S0FQ13_RUMCE|nr:carbohydrate ABC transporter permease [Ruminiclostridium cellobioparum]EMS72431.1 ABC-type sugar transport system, permease component [Ruminiclostridium cellobioparum subsp. termitidis CT1112]